MRSVLFIFVCIISKLAISQVPLYDYRVLNPTTVVPPSISSERSAVIVSVPDNLEGFRKVGGWNQLCRDAHKAFITMGIDPIFYLNHYDLVASEQSKEVYADLFSKRNVKNLLFLTKDGTGLTLTISPFNGEKSFLSNGADAFIVIGDELYDLMLKTGREIRRADYELTNFLIPEKPNFLSGVSIVEKTLLKNYPGILRRSTLAVERFDSLEIPKNVDEQVTQKLKLYNQEIRRKNLELEVLMKSYPYDYVLIDPMTDEDLLRNRHQFILRCISGQTKSLRQMLGYEVSDSETDFVSMIPILPDQSRAKPIPKNALVHKFYIKQNISKNVHVGEWDADETWQEALNNMIGNLFQELEVDK